ncbi:zinc finger, C2H2 type [Dictyocaulus viviparus]|uniref:Zinc finger, C2H2 type n=1 Tax=Dictyocaulus viviparus TaxID=29172 RepID=A0A0D8YCJ8_DICVI|nr:zinc finger, C2H2 type [Dictyocaulus viviparus]
MQGPYGYPQNNIYYPMNEHRFQPSAPEAYHRVNPQFDNQIALSEQIQINANYPMQYIPRQHQQRIYFTPPSTNPVCTSVPQQSSQMTLPITSLPPRPSSISPCEQTSLNSPTLTSNSGSASCETPPISGEAISTDLEGPDNERVMCMACRGVYPSRRSLTGHIGRNEKCREIIGRNYLDQVAMGANPIAPGTENAIKAGALTNGHDGLSPICPHCDRFISHYKGNIRRHINQCGKKRKPTKKTETGQGQAKRSETTSLGRPLDDTVAVVDGELEEIILNSSFAVPSPYLTAFDITALGTQNASMVGSPVMSSPLGSYLPSHEHDMSDNTTYTNSNHQTDQQIQLPSDPSPPGGPRKEADPPEQTFSYDLIIGICILSIKINKAKVSSKYGTGTGTNRIDLATVSRSYSSPKGITLKERVVTKDAYICDSCEFVTIYKGNMKRHLNTCHPAPDCKDLKEWDRKLESMRASMLGMSRVEMIDRLNAHRMNSTRGRKPRSKKNEEGAQRSEITAFALTCISYHLVEFDSLPLMYADVHTDYRAPKRS